MACFNNKPRQCKHIVGVLNAFYMKNYFLLLLAFITITSLQSCKKDTSNYDAFATKLEKSINEHNPDFFNQHFGFQAIINNIVNSIEVPDEYRKGFEMGVQHDLNVGETIVNLLGEDGAIKLLKIKTSPQPTAFYRVASSQGINYIEMYLTPSDSTEDKVLIKDFYIYRGGLTFSSTLQRLYYSPLANKLDSVKMNKTPSTEQAFIRNLAKIDTLTGLAEQKKYDEALALYATMPKALQQDKMLQVMRLNIAHQMGGKTYDDAIEEYQNLFPNDAALAYMQMNMAMADHDSLKLYTSIDALDKSIGGDPYLDIIRSDISYSYQNTVKARSYLEKALKTDPDLEDAYWRLVGLLIDGGKYDDAVAYFPKMKELFKVNPANFLPRDEYNGFWQAESYKKWAEKNPIDSSMLDAQQIAPQMPFDEEGADGHEGHGH